MTAVQTAQSLHEKLTIVDAHHDIMLDVVHRRKLGQRGSLSGYWGPRLREAGINVQLLPMYVEDTFLPELGLRKMLQGAEALLADLEDDDSVLQLATTYAEVESALADHKVAAVLAIEGCDGLSGDPAMLRVLYRLGVRMVGFTWNRRNEFADANLAAANPGGLTKAGLAALKDMADYHVICDVSHLSDAGFADVAKHTQGPFVASHSNARAICDHPRNLTDDQLRALADNGGVTGLNFYGAFVDAENPTISKVVDHLAHIADTVGIDHVGIGPDLLETPIRDLAKAFYVDTPHDPSELDNWVAECEDIENLPVLTAEMLARGFTEEDIAKVLGGNFLRVFQQVWT